MKRKAAIMIAAVLILIMAVPAFASAADYSTTNYNVQVNVKDDNSAYITEKIGLDINNGINGIYRYIPLSQTVTYNDKDGKAIEKVRNPMKVEDISVENDPFTKSKENGNMVIKIGDSAQTVNGKKTYTLSYRSRMYDDGVKDYDSFYYNVLPNNWETPIEKSGITINMPKKFNKDNVDVYAGSKDKRNDSDKISWKVKGNTITITAKEKLEQGSGITVGIKLPEGYFSGELSTFWMKILLCATGVIIAMLLGLFWFRFGRDPKIVQTVEFEPPAGIGPAEVGYIIDGSVDKKDIVSLIFWFAQKGYITIEEKDKKDFVLNKVKDLPDDARPFEKTFFNGLFEQGIGGSVIMSEIGPEFYSTFETTKEQVEEHFTENKKTRVFPRSASSARVGGYALMIVGFAIAAFVTAKIYASIWVCVPVGILCILTIIACALGTSATDKKYAKSLGGRITTALFSLIFIAAAAALTIFLSWWSIGFIFGGLAVALMEVAAYFTIRFMQSRTKYGTELMGKLLGFKEFIKAAEVEKLEAMIEENPSYFYDVLPYAYVFGLSKKWAKKFENIPTEEPYWYHGYYGNNMMFNTWLFYSAFNNCTNFAVNSMHIPEGNGAFGSGGGGSFGGGGGFSGGGFGGGGGGAW